MQLEIKEVVKAATHISTPVEEQLEESLLIQNNLKQMISLLCWERVQNLVKKPEHFGGRGAMVKVYQHFNSFQKENPVKICGYFLASYV